MVESKDLASNSVPLNQRTETPLDRSIVSKPKPVYEAGSALLPAKVWPNPTEGIRRDRTGNWVADIVVNDPNSNKNILLEGVRLEQSTQGQIQRINRTGNIYVSVPDQRLLAERDVTSMTARYVDIDVRSKNNSVPIDVLFNNFRSKVNEGSRNLCKILKFDYEREKADLNKYDSLTIYADPNNPDSAGMYVDNSTGEMGMFSKYEGNVIIGKNGVSIDSKKFNRGSSNQTKNGLGTLGLPGNENEIQDILPRSNILLGVPMLQMPYYPDFARILYSVGLLYKMVRVGIVCSEFIKEG